MAPFAPRPSHGNSHLPRPRHAHQNMKNVLATLAVSATTGEWIAVNKLIRLKDFPAWSRLETAFIMHEPAELCYIRSDDVQGSAPLTAVLQLFGRTFTKSIPTGLTYS